MLSVWKSDLYRLGKSRLFYGIVVFACLIALALTVLIRQNFRLGISVFGDLTAFKGVDDIIRIGLQYQKGLGLLVAVLVSVFIGQEYLWKTWQHKWIAQKSRPYIYLSKMALSCVMSAGIFVLFEMVALLSSGQIYEMLTSEYISRMVCGIFVYTALGAIVCMLSMLIRNSITSVIICLCYVIFSETLVSAAKNICGLSDVTAKVSDWIISHSIYGMSLRICGTLTPESILPIFVNMSIIIGLSAVTGILFFSKYEL